MNVTLDDLSIFQRRIKKMNKAVFKLYLLYVCLGVVLIIEPLCLLGVVIISYYCHTLVAEKYGKPAYRKRTRQNYKDIEQIVIGSYYLNAKSLSLLAKDFEHIVTMSDIKDDVTGYYGFGSYKVTIYI